MSNIIVVNGVNIPEVPYHGQRVVTFEMVANVHGVLVKTVESSYQKNAHRFIEGKHTYLLKGQELQEFKDSHANSGLVIPPRSPSLRIFTEQGYYKLIKPMGDDVSWDVQDEMAEVYFQVSHQLIQNPNLPRSPEKVIADRLDMWGAIGAFFKAPDHMVMIEAAKDIKLLGIDVTPLLQASPAMDNIQDDQVMLEPTELAKRLGFSSGRTMNNQLRDMGLQARINSEWVPTDLAQGMYFKHTWTKGTKSGINLKWNFGMVKAKLEAYTESHYV